MASLREMCGYYRGVPAKAMPDAILSALLSLAEAVDEFGAPHWDEQEQDDAMCAVFDARNRLYRAMIRAMEENHG